MRRHVFLAISLIALAVACGGDSRTIDVRHPPRILKTLARIAPSRPVRMSEISGPCAVGGLLNVDGRCVATVAKSSSMIRKAHLHLVAGSEAEIRYTPAGSSDAIRMKVTPEDPAHIPIRRDGGSLFIRCADCGLVAEDR
ncbi:MAG: hypothetical protein WBX15_03965 [Thermoanaerobaculia bacterium]